MQLEGVIPVIPTPFLEDENIDYDSHATLIEFCIESGAGGILLPAYGSEFYKLTSSECRDLIAAAVRVCNGRVPVVAQCNHVSSGLAADLAWQCEKIGVDVISTELSHMFPFGQRQYLEYVRRIGDAISIPLLVQDWNPTGPTVDADWVVRLREVCENFRWLKLEEPAMGQKVRAIREATNDEIGVFEGWGGMYALELIPAGVCGLMPGVGLADVMRQVFELARAGQVQAAYERFTPFVPYLVFCMQNMEHFHHVEKRLLTRRGIIAAPHVRAMTIDLDPDSDKYLDLLIENTVAAINPPPTFSSTFPPTSPPTFPSGSTSSLQPISTPEV